MPDSPRRHIAVGTGFAVRALAYDPAVVARELYVEATLATKAGASKTSAPDALARLAPSLRLGLSRTAHAEIASTRGPASLVWTTVDVRGCVDLVHFARMNAGPCVAGAFGELDAQAFAPAIPTSRGRPWITVGALARLRLRVLPALSIEGDVGLARPLVRDAIFFEPTRVIYETPALVPSVGLAITAELP